jgi:hypothetical protein
MNETEMDKEELLKQIPSESMLVQVLVTLYLLVRVLFG